MAKYLVDYYETYSKSYEIEADSKEEAEKMYKMELEKDCLIHQKIVLILGVKQR